MLLNFQVVNRYNSMDEREDYEEVFDHMFFESRDFER